MIHAVRHSIPQLQDLKRRAERRSCLLIVPSGEVKRGWMPVRRRNVERYLHEYVARGLS